MKSGGYEIMLIGGSSGSFGLLTKILAALAGNHHTPVVIVIHRLKNVGSSLDNILSSPTPVWEPEDKEPIRAGGFYLAPQNYHLLIEQERIFSIDYSEPVNFSRPSIDVTFMSASSVYREKTLGILLSGSSKDGAAGIAEIIRNNGCGIIQDPDTAEFPFMPAIAMGVNPTAKILTPENIVHIIPRLLH